MPLSLGLLHFFSSVFRTDAAALLTRRSASGGGPNYFPGLTRKPQAAAQTAAAIHRSHLPPSAGGRRHSLTEADALAARRWALPRGSMSDPASSRTPLAPGLFVVEGGPAVATPGFSPVRTSVADPDWIAAAVPDHRAPA